MKKSGVIGSCLALSAVVVLGAATLNGCANSKDAGGPTFTLKSSNQSTSATILSAPLSPASNISTVYEFWMGQNANCTDMVKIIDFGNAGKYVDTEQGVDVGAGTLPPAGTYNCLAIVVSDTTSMKPNGTSSDCDPNTYYLHRTFRGSDMTILPGDPNTTIVPNNKNGPGFANFLPQKVAAYFSTAGSNGSGHSPADALPLAGGAVTVGTTSMNKTFFVNCAGKVQNGSPGTITQDGSLGACSTDACEVGFR